MCDDKLTVRKFFVYELIKLFLFTGDGFGGNMGGNMGGGNMGGKVQTEFLFQTLLQSLRIYF